MYFSSFADSTFESSNSNQQKSKESSDSIEILVENVAPTITEVTAESIILDDDDDNGNGAGNNTNLNRYNDEDEGVLITVNGTFTDPGSLDLHTGEAIWSDGVFTELTVDNDNNTFTTMRFLSEDELEDNFPEVDDDVFLVGVTTTIEDDDTGIAQEFLEIFVSEEEGVIV